MYITEVCLLAFVAVASAAALHLKKHEEPKLFQNSRIINGVEADANEFPHQATLLNGGYHMCGASIIANGWALTAAHCVDGQNAPSLAIVVDLHDFSNPGSYKWFDVNNYTMHPLYNQATPGFPNDVALLRLFGNGYDISDNAIDLALDTDNLFENERCVISGWGVTETGSGSNVLMKSNVTALTNHDCKNDYWGNYILSQHVCVMGRETNEGSAACNGDSGGPLVCQGLLAGVTSWGRSGCHDNGVVSYPSVYARVSHFAEWIWNNCGECFSL